MITIHFIYCIQLTLALLKFTAQFPCGKKIYNCYSRQSFCEYYISSSVVDVCLISHFLLNFVAKLHYNCILNLWGSRGFAGARSDALSPWMSTASRQICHFRLITIFSGL